MDTERLLVSKIAWTGRGLSEMIADGIDSTQFYNEESADVWQFMVSHQRKYNAMPSINVLRDRFDEYNFEQVKDDLKFLRDDFLNARERRLAIEFSKDLARACGDPDKAGKLGEYILEAGRDIMVQQPGHTVHRFSEMKKRLDEWHEARAAGGYGGIKIGIPAIDNATLGIRSHEFLAVVGWQGLGKSTLAQWIVFNAFGQGQKTLFISLEMNQDALYRKWDTMALEFESYKNLKGLCLSDNDIRRWKEYAEIMAKPPEERPEDMRGELLVLDDVRQCTVEKVHAEIVRHKPDLVVIDYLTLMEVPSLGGAQRWEKVAWVTRQLKQMALTMEVPIIGLAQTDRSSAKEGAKLDNIGASYMIGADADIVLGLHRPNDEDAPSNIMEVHLLKNRDGETLTEKIYWNMEKMLFAGTFQEGLDKYGSRDFRINKGEAFRGATEEIEKNDVVEVHIDGQKQPVVVDTESGVIKELEILERVEEVDGAAQT